ncbi:uncharacterized protein ATNIH1004_000826 [Aspergillus tanneri]|uniref:Uncharacterized protein n=1 Tax=Aspergillus tanneri TaxID=1220188 RepID=A0A5M9NBQ2_9EURO|nr:uncharacterized protein ATNIH1004_000826 [Aspergillus tanneri]KAA8651927.1 hypothetical protein ATNIH1004_000826 [Aspergillus tanneri]
MQLLASLPSARSAKTEKTLVACILRRVIPLGMHRPIQFVLDREDDCDAVVYTPHVKSALKRILIWQCEFAIAMTDPFVIVYPGSDDFSQGKMVRSGDSRWRNWSKSEFVPVVHWLRGFDRT